MKFLLHCFSLTHSVIAFYPAVLHCMILVLSAFILSSFYLRFVFCPRRAPPLRSMNLHCSLDFPETASELPAECMLPAPLFPHAVLCGNNVAFKSGSSLAAAHSDSDDVVGSSCRIWSYLHRTHWKVYSPCRCCPRRGYLGSSHH